MLAAEMPDSGLPQWLDKADAGTVGDLTLDDGERMTAQVVGFDDERDELVIDVISPERSHENGGQDGQAIPISRIVSFQPQPRAAQGWPYSDPCRGTSFSFARFVLMATLFLCMTVGSLPLFLLLMKRPYGFQAASAIVYTIFAMFFTFARTGTRTGKDIPPYMFTCPAVRPQFSRLVRRHLGFLVVLFALQTAALATRPNLPEWWNIADRRGATPLDLALMLLCLGLAYAQVFTNRSLLDRAHREVSAQGFRVG
jgi:hypothetical protein